MDSSRPNLDAVEPAALPHRSRRTGWLVRTVVCWSFGAVALLLVFLCVRSSHTRDKLYLLCNTTGYDGLGDRIEVLSNSGQLSVAHHYGHRGDKFLMFSSGDSYENRNRQGEALNPFLPSRLHHRAIGLTQYAAPLWLLSTVAVAAWAFSLRAWRFGVRDVLVATAVVSVLMAAALAEVRYPFTAIGDFISRPE